MHYVDRKFACDRLKLSRWQSYGVLRPSRMAMISTKDIIDLLNRSANGESAVSHVPSDIETAEGVERSLGIPAKRLVLWTRRKSPIPHYKINKQTTRYRLSSVRRWMGED